MRQPEGPALVGREAELRVIEGFLSRGSSACLVLTGEPGIGKTTLWEAGLEAADALGYRALSARASEAEAGLSFAALGDLVDGVGPEVLGHLPAPQLHALDVALRRIAPVGPPPEQLAISAGFLTALRMLADRQPVVVAVDDLHWLDRPSADSLMFAARRSAGHRVRFLLSRRKGRAAGIEGVLQRNGVEHVDVTGLSFGATCYLLSERLRLVPSRRVLRQVFETSQGNPLLALELGRLLEAGGGTPEIGAELPVPELVDDLFGARVRGLPGPMQRALLAVSLSAGLTRPEFASFVDPLAIEDGVSSGLLVVEPTRVRASHPLLAAAARQGASARERRAMHLELASAVSDPILRARHLAMATPSYDGDLASTVAAASQLAIERGAIQDAEELAAHALRLTPPDAVEQADRVLALARCHLATGDLPRSTELLSGRLEELPAGRARAFAHLLLGEAAAVTEEDVHLEQALAEAGDDPELLATVLARKATVLVVNRVERVDEAEMLALQALSFAERAGTEVERRVMPALAWSRVLLGRPIDDLLEQPASGSPGTSLYESSVERPLAVRLAFRGQVEQSGQLLARLLAQAEDRGDARFGLVLQVQLCELDLRCGDVRAATRRLDEVQEWTGLEAMDMPRARLHAVRAAVAGVPAEARRWAALVLGAEGPTHNPGWDQLETNRALGLSALFEHDARRAIDSLSAVWEHTLRQHVDDPGAFPVAGELVEALVQAGAIETASEVTERLRHLGVAQSHPWGLVTTKRCDAILRLARNYLEGEAAMLSDAAGAYGRLGLNFDRARCLLFLGGLQRRHKKRSAARLSLREAEAVFEQLGCGGWAEQARSELARVSGRRSAEEGLTPSERRVVDLAANGFSNKEIAGQLFVSVYTVEAHLTHAYGKLGVRSRAQLAQRLGARR
jgi:DNA-binding CsgD family transcriptional regulator